FAGDHGEAAALFACPGSLDGGIERQDVGLEGDAVDHLDDVADLLAGRIHALDLLRRLVHDVRGAGGRLPGRLGQVYSLPGVAGVVLDQPGQLVHRRCGLGQAAGRQFGLAAEVPAALGDFGRGMAQAVQLAVDIVDEGSQVQAGVGDGSLDPGDPVQAG